MKHSFSTFSALLTLSCIVFLFNGCSNSQFLKKSSPPSEKNLQTSADNDLQPSNNTDKNDIDGDSIDQSDISESSSADTDGDTPQSEPQISSQENSTVTKTDSDSENDNKATSEDEIQSAYDEALEYCQAAQDFWQKGEIENALEALDQAYLLILKFDPDDNSKFIQQKEDLRFTISKRILEIYASRNIVVNGDYDAIPIELNKHILAEIKNFTKGAERKFFIQSYKRSGKFRQEIVKELKAAGMPTELSWLPLIESGFKVKALSKARALGLWQFIPSTGYKFGLKRNTYIDERMDPTKSTKAAIAYLKELHQIFGDWKTVLAGYNCGEGKVLKVIRSQNVNYLDDFWDLYERLPWETARYVPRFLAVIHIVNNLKEYGFENLASDPPLEYATVDIQRQCRLKDIAKQIGVPYKKLKELNPELRYSVLPPETYGLKVPSDKGETLLANLENIPISTPPRPNFIYHKVRRGETLSTIARKYRSSVRRIAQANNIHRRHYIVAGKILKIPSRGTSISYVSNAKHSASHFSASTHRVRKGDSLWNIAKKYGTTVKKIQQLNHLTSTRLSIGQLIKIPGHQSENTGA